MERIRKALAGRTDAMLGLIERLVQVNSFTDNIEGGNAVGALLAAEIRAIPGMHARSIASTRYATHWIGESDAARGAKEGFVAFVGHLDTVFPPGIFEGFRRDGELARGPGVLDMKGGLVVMLEALRVLAKIGELPRIPVRLAIVSDEEVGSPEGRAILHRELGGAACALAFEAGRKADAIITARKGTGAVHVEVEGKAAHAGANHKDGANAIWALARFIDHAQRLTDYDRGVTVNVGKISGGTSKNTVPEHAEAQVDFRYVRLVDGQATVAAFEEAAKTAAAEVPGTTVTVQGGIARAPLERTDANVALFQEYAAHARAAGLGHAEAALIGGGSDASSTAEIGIPSIDAMGPRGTGFHTKDEQIEIASLVPKAEALAAFLLGRARP
ncbi:M20/M25/M40 family metallo-hydrolase [Chondromyces crocatus]|uniref:Peptidase M20 n=1 Tax=Chondromyces crocatus TaxID=52 RepID=A0A0K1E9F5_CHOCO|nr:M20/M25/M40 family metallo-hydrolase [Chondromyces crocatus]AKT37203.1 peptidase M20 [Chondromyces crocatus]